MILFQKALDHICLKFHSVHQLIFGDRSKIGILKRLRIRTDEHDLSGPVLGRHLPGDHLGNGDSVRVSARRSCKWNVNISFRIDRRQGYFLPRLFQINPGRFICHGINRP